MNIQTLDIFEENDVSAFEFVEDLGSYTSDVPLFNMYSEYKGAILKLTGGACEGEIRVFAGITVEGLAATWSTYNKDNTRLCEIYWFNGNHKNRVTDLTKEFIKDVHSLACQKGWWKEPTNEEHKLAQVTRALLMIHGEVSEATECFRDPEPKMSEKIPEYLQSTEELADVVIRCMDLAEFLGEDLLGAIKAKHEFNKGRDYRHGGKLL